MKYELDKSSKGRSRRGSWRRDGRNEEVYRLDNAEASTARAVSRLEASDADSGAEGAGRGPQEGRVSASSGGRVLAARRYGNSRRSGLGRREIAPAGLPEVLERKIFLFPPRCPVTADLPAAARSTFRIITAGTSLIHRQSSPT
ncbi:hypothetical protein KM043_000198 [Ampulex compressa]|nr:hypothetical protein KM043_000198 [Ampulex compressa]